MGPKRSALAGRFQGNLVELQGKSQIIVCMRLDNVLRFVLFLYGRSNKDLGSLDIGLKDRVRSGLWAKNKMDVGAARDHPGQLFSTLIFVYDK